MRVTHADYRPTVTTILERLRAAGLSEERALNHLRSGFVVINDQIVTDPNAAGEGRWVLVPPPITDES